MRKENRSMSNTIIYTDNLVKTYRRYKKQEGICGIIAPFSAITCAVWKRGLRHYNSAGS